MQFVKYVVGIWLFTASIIAAIVVVSRTQAIPPALQALHFKDCELPCWIGIIPGKTTIGEAERNIANTYNAIYPLFGDSVVGYWEFVVADKETGIQIRVKLNSITGQPSSAIVNDITIIQDEPGPTVSLGELESLLGSPENILESPPDDIPRSDIIFNNGRIHSFTTKNECNRVTDDEPIMFLVIYAQFPADYALVSHPLTWAGYNKCNRFVP